MFQNWTKKLDIRITESLFCINVAEKTFFNYTACHWVHNPGISPAPMNAHSVWYGPACLRDIVV